MRRVRSAVAHLVYPRCNEAGRTAATRRRGKEWRQTSRARIGSRRQHGAMPPVGSTQRHRVFTLPPTTDYRYRVHLFHVKPAVGCSLIRFLRRRASASWQERGPVPTETVALCGYGPPQSDTRRFSSRAVIPGVGVLPANKRRPHRSVSDGTRSCMTAPAPSPGTSHRIAWRVTGGR